MWNNSWLAVNKDGKENIYLEKPEKKQYTDLKGNLQEYWDDGNDYSIPIPKGTIEKLTGKRITWEDEPIELVCNDETLKLSKKEEAIALVAAYFEGKDIIMKDPAHGVPDWVSVRDPEYWSYLSEFCRNIDKYRIVYGDIQVQE